MASALAFINPEPETRNLRGELKRIRQVVNPDLQRDVAKAEDAVKAREAKVDTKQKAKPFLFKSDSFKGNPFSSSFKGRESVGAESPTALSGPSSPTALDRQGSHRGSHSLAK